MKTKIITLGTKLSSNVISVKPGRKKLEKDLEEALRKAKAAGNKEDIAEAKYNYNSEMC